MTMKYLSNACVRRGSLLSVLFYMTVLMSGCVDGGGDNSVKETVSWEKTNIRGEPTLRYTDNSNKWPRVCGATALYPLYASAYRYLIPGDNHQDPGLNYMYPTRTPEAYNDLIKRQADVIFVAQPSAGQKQRAADAGVKLVYTPFAHEAFVFIVNASNPVSSLTEQQVRDIFSGKITRWSQVGGGDERIQVWQRPEDSGSQTVMLAKVMKETPMLPARTSTEVSLMNGVLTKVIAYRNTQPSIGYTFLYYVTQMNKDISSNLKLLAINSIAPTVENIRNGTYPYVVDAYMVTREKPTPETQKLVDWFLSPQGQSLVEDVGYVPLYKTLSDNNQ
ncbi:PstS family phosphate ABC transporter substrate-binding protein [Escherichia albertii]|uniref:PstS family phosphate ABC transporter substrate-binding protein n=1 Tax=Escherichia albertii TaxID=208962 RepID=UPI00387E122B